MSVCDRITDNKELKETPEEKKERRRKYYKE
jgi:hypothetical protein